MFNVESADDAALVHQDHRERAPLLREPLVPQDPPALRGVLVDLVLARDWGKKDKMIFLEKIVASHQVGVEVHPADDEERVLVGDVACLK